MPTAYPEAAGQAAPVATAGRAVAEVLWTSPGPTDPPWRTGVRRLDRWLLGAVAGYALVVAIVAAGGVINDSGRANGGVAFLLLLPLPIAVVLALYRPLDGWRLSTIWLVATPFLIQGGGGDVPLLEPWQWCFWCPVLFAAAWAVPPRATLVVGALSLLVVLTLPGWSPWTPPLTFVPALLGVGVPLVVGASLGARQRAGRDLAAEQVRAAETQAARGALAERARIAREMHDVVAHHLSLIAVRCETAPYRLAPLPEPAAGELAEIAGTAREALTELQRLLGVLRSDDQSAERAPQPGLGTLPGLLAAVRAAGTDLEWDVEPVVVPDLVGLTAFRVVQQAVANAAQHAPGSAVRVRVVRDADDLVLEVTNGPGAAPGRAGAGLGLQGMRERVEVHAGRLDAGPLADGGFRVAARLPLGAGGER
ncbi:sensor histidine kinase [Blastococcus sp. SYSU D00922]